jgi:5-methylcytosine-specific restriction endonuclease McrA
VAGNGRNSHQKRVKRRRLFGGHRERPCCFCRRPLTEATATLEHVLPLSLGGGWGLDNLRLSCLSCNSERGTEDFSQFRRRKNGGHP